MYTVVAEYDLCGQRIQHTLENVDADSENDAFDAAYEKIVRDEPEAKNVEILSVTKLKG